MARTTPVCFGIKLRLKANDESLQTLEEKLLSSPEQSVTKNNPTRQKSTEFERSQIKRSLPQTKVRAKRVHDDVKSVCKDLSSMIIQTNHASVNVQVFEAPLSTPSSPPSIKEAFIDLNKILELRNLKIQLQTVSPVLEAVVKSLESLNEDLTSLRDTSLEAFENNRNFMTKKSKISPRLSKEDVDKLFLNFIILTALTDDKRYIKAQQPLIAYWNIHRRLLFTQLKFAKNEYQKEQKELYETKFKTFLQNIQEQGNLFKLVEKVSILKVLDSFQNYSSEDDPLFVPDIIHAQLMKSPQQYHAEIRQILTMTNCPQLQY